MTQGKLFVNIVTISFFLFVALISINEYTRDLNEREIEEATREIVEEEIDDYVAQFIDFDYLLDDRDYREDNIEVIRDDSIIAYVFVDYDWKTKKMYIQLENETERLDY